MAFTVVTGSMMHNHINVAILQGHTTSLPLLLSHFGLYPIQLLFIRDYTFEFVG